MPLCLSEILRPEWYRILPLKVKVFRLQVFGAAYRKFSLKYTECWLKMNWIKIFDPEILQAADFIRGMEVNGKKFCVIKTGDSFFATQFYCPHAGAALAYGWCKNQKLICPYHRYEYDLQTGRGAPGQGDYINTYPIEIKEDGVYVQLPESSFLKKLFRL